MTGAAEEASENHSFVMSSECGGMQFVVFFVPFVLLFLIIVVWQVKKRRDESKTCNRKGGKRFVLVPIVTVK